MPYLRSDMTSQTGSAYKAALDAATAALAGGAGKRRNVNGDGRVNQLGSAVAISTAWQYVLDMWEAEAGAGASGGFGQVADAGFPAQVGIGTAGLATTAVATIAFRTKIESRSVTDLLAAPFQYPVAVPAHPFAALGLLAYHDCGQPLMVTPVLRSADAADNFSTMSHALTGAAAAAALGRADAALVGRRRRGVSARHPRQCRQRSLPGDRRGGARGAQRLQPPPRRRPARGRPGRDVFRPGEFRR